MPIPKPCGADLSGSDALLAQAALCRLVLAPEQTLPMLAGKLRPVEPAGKERLARLLRELEHDEFARREQARQELFCLGDVAAPTLLQVLEGRPPIDLKRRVDDLLEEINPGQAAPYRGQTSRAVAVLEQIGSPEARKLLWRLAAGEPAADLTRQTQQACQRLNP